MILNELQVFAFRTRLSGASPSKRAEQSARALQTANSRSVVSISTAKNESKVLVNGHVVARISPAEAKAHGSSPSALAQKWRDLLKAAIALPPIRALVTEVRVPVGATTEIKIIGSQARNFALASDQSKVQVKREANKVRVKALKVGSSTVRLMSGKNQATIQVDALPVAAAFPQRIVAQVTGNPAHSSTVRGAICSALQTRLKTVQGGRIIPGGISAVALGPGASRTFLIPVTVNAENACGSKGNVEVVVSNVALKKPEETELWYCNHPENVTGNGQLFAAKLKPTGAVRLLYHHLNASSMPIIVQGLLQNLSNEWVKVAIIPGDGTPDKDPVRCGAEAGDRFVKGWLTGSGEVLEIAPHSVIPIALRRLAPGETISGLCRLQAVKAAEGSVIFRAEAFSPNLLDPRWHEATNLWTPWHVTGSRPASKSESAPLALSEHVYPEPFKTLDADYTVGGAFTFVRIGQKPIGNGEKMLDGNFGVVYTIKSKLSNPTDRIAEIDMMFEASAGYSAAIFVLNGRAERTPMLQSKQEYRIRRLRLAPGQIMNIVTQTIPLSGSSYPATITFRPSSESQTAPFGTTFRSR